MNRIYKYPLPLEDEPYVLMPTGARVLSVQLQRGVPTVWALIDTAEKRVSKHWFFVIGTGHMIDFDLPAAFLGTIQLHDGALVFHVFDNGEACSPETGSVEP